LYLFLLSQKLIIVSSLTFYVNISSGSDLTRSSKLCFEPHRGNSKHKYPVS